QVLQLLFGFLVVRKQNDESTHLLVALGDFGVKFLDQTGQGVVDLACEDHGDRPSAVLSDQALFLAVPAWIVSIADLHAMERHADLITDLWAGFEVPGDRRAA